MNRYIHAFICLCLAATCQARIITIDDDGPADFNNTQAAINNANDGDTVLVTQGVYTGDGNRDIDFRGKAITVRSTDPNNPDIIASTIIDCNGTQAEPHRGFYFHNGEDTNSVLTGLTITNGYANSGGGIRCEQSSPAITKCTISNNSAGSGGGVCCYSGSNPMITDCTISNNTAGAGGGMVVPTGSSPILTNCVFISNRAENGGGGIFSSGNPALINCKFINNSTLGDGGGIESFYYSKITVINCMFWGNSAVSGGGITSGEETIIKNCTFSGNTAEYDGGAIFCREGFGFHTSIVNSILWGDNAAVYTEVGAEWWDCGSKLSISFSNFPFVAIGSWELDFGPGNIDADPCFADTNNGDFHLKSQAGRWDANEGRWTKDEVTSPCIDAGNPHSPIGLEPFPNGGIINIGAYGGTAEASKSYFGEPVCEVIVAGDINGDCKVDLRDFALMAFHWLEEH